MALYSHRVSEFKCVTVLVSIKASYECYSVQTLRRYHDIPWY